jgi:type I restriction-modification system DNA methylase subunit
MAKKEIVTDYWVRDLLHDAGIVLEPQGSSILEIDNALKSASKKGTGNVGFPEFVGVVKDFLIVIENKASIAKHKKVENGVISLDPKDVINHAVNGALFYGQHLAKNTSYKKIIAFGISGNEKKHEISPIYIDETEYYRELPAVESFISFNEMNIDEYYTREVLNEETNQEKETAEILADAKVLHEDLRNYGNLKDVDKPLIVSGVLLALRESEHKGFSINDLTGDDIKTDGQKIYDAILSNLTRSRVAPEVKKDKILSQFSLIKDTKILNEINPKLGKTPLKHYVEFLNEKIYRSIKYTSSSEDFLGRFYGEFMSYSGGDGQALGIVLTPKHITDLFCDLVDINHDDVVLDPTCGTAGFLVASMHHMLEKLQKEKNELGMSESEFNQRERDIKQKQLHGIELQPYMFTIATTNMILRGDGKSNLINDDFIAQSPSRLQLKQATVGMINPPYSQGSKKNPDLYEINFVRHLLDSQAVGGRCIAIIPQSSMTGKTKEEAELKEDILKRHTLEGVITLNKDSFYGVGTMPCIAIFRSGIPHEEDKECKFIDFRNDGFKVAPHIGLIETEQAKDKKQHLLDVWFDRLEAETKFCVKTTVQPDDEWLHSFYYFNDEVPTDKDFEKTIGDYLTFEFSMIMQNREYLFEEVSENEELKQ